MIVIILKIGICTTEGKTWEQHREFFHQQMRNFLDEGGKGTQGFIEVIMDEIDDIRIDLAKKVLLILFVLILGMITSLKPLALFIDIYYYY